MMKKALAIAFVGTMLLVPAAADAHVIGKNDPNDVSGRLDIRRFGMEHDNKILLGVKFDQGVNKGDFAGGNHAGFNLETSGDAIPDRRVEIRRKRGKLKCTMFRSSNDRRVGAVGARLDGSKIECVFPDRLLRSVPNAFNAFSTFNGNSDNTDILAH
jgi:hypothetical protein